MGRGSGRDDHRVRRGIQTNRGFENIRALDQYYRFHAARRHILRRMNRFREAAEAYERALALATDLIKQDFPKRHLTETEGKIIVSG
jgi:predicted RNA polymerase sigma factor